MSRPRLTEEEAIAKWGSLRRYHQHLKAVARYQKEHADERREYRIKNRAHLSKMANDWRLKNPEKARESIKKRIREMQKDPEFKRYTRERLACRRILIKLGLLRDGYVIHYPWGVDRRHFIYLPEDEHKGLHAAWGKENKNVTWERILEHPEMISEIYAICDGKVTRHLGSRVPGRRILPLCRKEEGWRTEEVVK